MVSSAVASDGSQWVAVGDDGTILTSPDGARWTTRASVTDKRLAGVASGASQWVAVGQRAIVLTSPDGETWTPRNGQAYGTTIRRSSRHPTEFLRGVAGDGAQWLTVGDQGTIATSSDGVTWTRQGSVSRERLAGVTAGG